MDYLMSFLVSKIDNTSRRYLPPIFNAIKGVKDLYGKWGQNQYRLQQYSIQETKNLETRNIGKSSFFSFF